MATVTIIVEDQEGGQDVAISFRSDVEKDSNATMAERVGMLMVNLASTLGESTERVGGVPEMNI